MLGGVGPNNTLPTPPPRPLPGVQSNDKNADPLPQPDLTHLYCLRWKVAAPVAYGEATHRHQRGGKLAAECYPRQVRPDCVCAKPQLSYQTSKQI